jgi:hypothetical protein
MTRETSDGVPAGEDVESASAAASDIYKVLTTTPASEVLHPMLDKCRFPISA